MNSKNILCLSWCDADDVVNYGQILQGCAMMYLLRNLSNGKIIYVSYLPRNAKAKIVYLKAHLNPLNGHVQGYYKTLKFLKWFIKKFQIQFYQVSNKNSLNKLANGCDLLICGSDQLWHPQNYDSGYFLDFGSASTIRASYAVSLPKSKLESQFDKEIELISKSIKKLDYISVREKGSIDFLSLLSKKNVVQVLDPTYLVPKELWLQKKDKYKFPEKYIFVYIPNGMDEKMDCYINIIKQGIRCDDVLLLMTRGKCLIEKSRKLKYVSLGQFLSIIQHASAIFTSSFHAVVFSTIFHKEFWCYDVPNESRGEDLRLRDLLALLKIENRLIQNTNNLDFNNKIDYSLVDNILDRRKKDSLDYLDRVLRRIK